MMEYQPTNQTQPISPAPDETGYYMPAADRGDSWVYGDPSQSTGQMARPQTAAAAQAAPQTMMEPQTPISGMNGGELPGGMSSAAAQSQRMKNPVNMADTHMPNNAEDAYQASLRSLLNRNLGYFVEATFLIGPDRPITWKGILHSVGTDYVVLYQPDFERYVSGDLYSLKFVQFHNIKGIPYCSSAQNWQGHPNL